MVTINEIIALAERAKNSGINRIYCHHTGGLYKMNSVEKEHYHICIESDGTVRINGELTDYKEHTWHRNSNAIGIALCCAYGATVYKNPERINWNGYPPTPIQVERLAEVICFIATVLEIPIDSEHVMTHAESLILMVMAFMVMKHVGFSFNNLFSEAMAVHPKGVDIMKPGGLVKDPISALSLGLGLMFGTAGLPHILMRFFTVSDAREARKSVFYATGFMGYFYILTFIIGFGAIMLVGANPEYKTRRAI